MAAFLQNVRLHWTNTTAWQRPEFWLVELVNNRIEVHALPNEGVYQEVRIILRHQNIISRVLPHLKLKASDILG